ncbi:MAG: replication-associated recombination protein A [Simkaniaceae bacterium]|nr:replication-associated recombination protein A [Simkaniaceae bacterium]
MKLGIPLAERLRPQQLSDVVGQDHLIGEKGILSLSIQKKCPLSLLLWGPPGCGKTTLARLYAKAFDHPFIPFSATDGSAAEIKSFLKEATFQPLLFVDEIHRLNKGQQDLFLPYVENGKIILIGATTENPSFSINNALLSRLRVLSLLPLNELSLEKILLRSSLSFEQEAKQALIALCQGDARYLINTLENFSHLKEEVITLSLVEQFTQKKFPLYDKQGDYHFNLISALHKSVRTSDPDAALYYFYRMMEGGEDPQYIGRRLIRMALEDIGLADPQALSFCISAWEGYHRLGSPEGDLSLAGAVVYLALAPKSNALYKAATHAQKEAKESSLFSPPKQFEYDHDHPYGISHQNPFPQELGHPSYYTPVERGFERELKKRLEFIQKIKNPQT